MAAQVLLNVNITSIISTLMQLFFGTLISSLLKEEISQLSDQFKFSFFLQNLPHRVFEKIKLNVNFFGKMAGKQFIIYALFKMMINY